MFTAGRGKGFWAGLGAVVLTAMFAGWFGYSWWYAENDDGIKRAVARDEALRAGQHAIATFNTLDYRDVDAGYGRWLTMSTGKLHQELATDQDGSKDKVEKARTVTEGRILDAAVSELDERVGRARVIASVEVVVKPEGGQPATKRNRFQAEMTRTDAGWKLSGIGQVPVGNP